MPKILLHFDLRCRPPWGQVDFVLHFCRSDPALEIFMIHDRHILVQMLRKEVVPRLLYLLFIIQRGGK
jgi:hypothetical protein